MGKGMLIGLIIGIIIGLLIGIAVWIFIAIEGFLMACAKEEDDEYDYYDYM